MSQYPAAGGKSFMSSDVARLSDTSDTRGHRTKRLCLDSGISPRPHPVSSQIDGRPQDTGIVMPGFQTTEETNAGLQGLLAAADIYYEHERSRSGHGEGETRNPLILQLGNSTRPVLTGGNLFSPGSNPSSLPSKTTNSGSMTLQVQAWQLSRQSTGQTLPLPHLENVDAWVGTGNVTGDQTLPLPQLGNMDAWVGTVTGDQTLPLPQLGNMDAWVGTGKVTEDQTLPLPQLGNMEDQTLPLPQLRNMDAWMRTENVIDEMSTWTQS